MSLNACAGLVARGDPDRYLSVLAAPLAARRVLLPIYAFNLEVARAPWVTDEPLIAEMRLQWWRDVLNEIRAGGTVRRHEVAEPLSKVISPEGVAALDRIIDARSLDVGTERLTGAEALDQYLLDTGGALMWAAAHALGGTRRGEIEALGWASGVASLLLALPELEARGRSPLPDPGAASIRSLAQDGLARLREARRARLTPAARPALRAAWRAGHLLAKAEAEPARVMSGALAESEARRRGTLLWLTFRNRY